MTSDIIKCLIVGYFFGCISTSYIIGKLYHIDIREYGSGNAGTTNTMRVLGKQAGMLVYLGDCIKCALAILIMCTIYVKGDTNFNIQLVKMVTGFGVVLGHNYPFWLKFKGGKGIAVTSAVILIFCLPTYWICPAICLIAFVGIIQSTRYVSLGSLVVVSIFLAYVAIVFYGETDYLYFIVFAGLFTISAYITHRANIIRLINGTENKLGEKKDNNHVEVRDNHNQVKSDENNRRQQSIHQNKKIQDTAELERFCDAEIESISDKLNDSTYDDFSVNLDDLSEYRDAVPSSQKYNNNQYNNSYNNNQKNGMYNQDLNYNNQNYSNNDYNNYYRQ